MSLIGTLEQFNLASVLQRVEAYNKTGLMTIQQVGQPVELYLRDGRLMCVGPVRTNATLGDRLLQDGVITPHALQETLVAVGNASHSETRMALTLMDLGYVSHEELRAWATHKASEVLQVLLSWTSGEVYFDEDAAPPNERLLVALSITTLLSELPAPVSVPQAASHPTMKQEEFPQAAQQARNAPTLVADLLDDDPPPTAVFSADAFASLRPAQEVMPSGSPADAAAVRPVAVRAPAPAKRIDTSFMRPDMVLTPLDLSSARERNPQVQLSPDQWRLLTKVDANTSLQVACQELSMTPDLVCQVAGELIAESLIQLSMPMQLQTDELSPVSRDLLSSGIHSGLAGSNPSRPLPADVLPPFGSAIPFETQSQWGNGGNNATFVPGRGWIAAPQPLQPLQTDGPLASSYGDAYARTGGSHS